MANLKVSALTDIFLYDGFGFFGFGDGGFGGTYELLNPQWNTNSGNFGFDPIALLPYVEASDTPSYVGASLYDLEDSSFFAKITPAPTGNGGIQTGLLIRFDRHNYVEMSYGPNGQFNAYVSNDSNITVVSMPAYDSVTHAYWRIRNIDRVNLFFDTSPDGVTWTQQGMAPYAWDASSVTVSIFAGFTGLESSGNFAHVSNVNLAGTNLALSGSASGSGAAGGLLIVSDPNSLSGSVSGAANLRGSFNVTLGIPEGGLTDFIYTGRRIIDPLITNAWQTATFTTINNASPVVTASWAKASSAYTAPSAYRDNSYWQPAAYGVFKHKMSGSPDAGPDLMTNVQTEVTSGINNRLPLVASLYDNCTYSPGAGVSSVIRTTDIALNGQYSGKITSNTGAVTIGDGTYAYWVYPQSQALIPVRKDSGGNSESLFGSVYLSTQRANTTWFASFIYYDANFNILSQSTYQHVSITNKNTHPGGGVWQPGSVFDNAVPNTAVYVGVVPFINVTSPTVPGVETVYVTNNSISTASTDITEVATAFTEPRTANINVKADRVNYVLNSGFNAGSTEWFQGNSGISGSPNSASMVWDSAVGYKSAGSLRLDTVPPSGTYTGTSNSKLGLATTANFSGSARQPVVQGLKIGHTYTVTAWVKQGPNCPDVFMDFRDSNSLGVTGISVNTTKITNPENTEGNWTRVQTTYTVPPTGLTEYYFFFYVKFPDLANAPFSFWIDSLMVEEAYTYNGYFDGGFASADYKWESGKTANLARSYYYKDYNHKIVRLNKAITSVLPVGEYYNLLFAQPIT